MTTRSEQCISFHVRTHHAFFQALFRSGFATAQIPTENTSGDNLYFLFNNVVKIIYLHGFVLVALGERFTQIRVGTQVERSLSLFIL